MTGTGAERRRFEGHEGWVTGVTLLPDGRRALSWSDDRTVRLWNLETSTEWDLETGAELARLTFDAAQIALASSPLRQRAVVGDTLGRVHVVDLID